MINHHIWPHVTAPTTDSNDSNAITTAWSTNQPGGVSDLGNDHTEIK